MVCIASPGLCYSPERISKRCSSIRIRRRITSALLRTSYLTHSRWGDRGSMVEVPDYSAFASEYATSRPRYPPELFAWLARLVTRRDVAWDAATGNGQAALGLAAHFDRVIATDMSASQIENATRHPRIEYRVAPVEQTGLPDHS